MGDARFSDGPGGRTAPRVGFFLVLLLLAFGGVLAVLVRPGRADARLETALAATEAMESYRASFSQETARTSLARETTQIGPNSESALQAGGLQTTVRLVDGRVYELDGTTWHLKPWPARALTPAVELSEFTTMIAGLPAVEVERTSGTVTHRIVCGPEDQAELDPTVQPLCDGRTTTTATVSLLTGLLVEVQVEGQIEVYPERYEAGTVTVEVAPVERTEPIVVPEPFDVERASCIGGQLGTSDYDELSVLLDDALTEENRLLFTGCGFEIWPPGTDFGSGEPHDGALELSRPSVGDLADSILTAAEADSSITLSQPQAFCIAAELIESDLSDVSLSGLVVDFDAPEVATGDADRVEQIVEAAARSCLQG